MNELYVRTLICNLPYGIHGFSRKNEDGGYSIVLNARESHDSNLATYFHEIKHIQNGDFERFDVQQIEYDAHNIGA